MTSTLSKHHRPKTFVCFAALYYLAKLSAVNAQSVVTPISQVPSQPQAAQEFFGIKPTSSSLDSAFAALVAEPPLRIGQATFLPHLFYSYVYGDGIQALPGHPVTTSINTISPGLLVDYGTHWTIDYAPSWTYYSSRAFRDTSGQSANLNGIAELGEWTFTGTASYLSSTQPLVETGMQTSEKDYIAAFKATRQLGSKFLLNLNADEAIRYAVGFPNSKETSTLDWLTYRLTPGFDFGVGGSVGYVSVSKGADTKYYTPEAQITFRATDKITLNLNGGIEHSQFIGKGSSDLNGPIYNLSVLYQPFDTTKLTLSSGESVSSSYFEDQKTRAIQWNAKLEQRLLGHYFLAVSLDQNSAKYFTSNGAVFGERNDRQIDATLRLSTIIFGRESIAIFYEKSRNSSSLPGFGFSSNQIGFEFGYRY